MAIILISTKIFPQIAINITAIHSLLIAIIIKIFKYLITG